MSRMLCISREELRRIGLIWLHVLTCAGTFLFGAINAFQGRTHAHIGGQEEYFGSHNSCT